MSTVHNAGRLFVRGLTLSAIAVAFVVAAQSNAQVVCQKVNGNGKAKFKIRDACKVGKGETQIAAFGDLVQRNETDGLAEQLAQEVAAEIAAVNEQIATVTGQVATVSDQVAAVAAEVDAVPRTRILRGDTFAKTVGTALEQVGSTFEFETFAASSNVSITVDADCTFAVPFVGDFMQIDIVVDGEVAIPTTGDNDPFCASAAGNNFVASNPGSRTVVVEDLPEGAHSIVLSASMNQGAAFLTEGSLSVVVSENELADEI